MASAWKLRVGGIAAGMVIVFVALAALFKLFDLEAFLYDLQSWPLPRQSLVPLAVLVPTFEGLLCTLWLAGYRRQEVERCTLGLLASFTILLAAAAFLAEPPKCSCLGLIEQYFKGVSSVKFAIWRDIALLALLTFGHLRRFPWDLNAARGARQVAHEARPGFTLIETLVGIVIICLLIALVLPSLSSVRQLVRRTQTLNNLSQCNKLLSVYSNDYKDFFPAFADTMGASTVIRLHSGLVVIVDRYFDTHQLWHYAIADGYLNGNANVEFVHSAEQLARFGPSGSPFFLSCAMSADPLYWDINTRMPSGQLRGMRFGDVSFPAKKSLLISWYSFEELGNDGTVVAVPTSEVDGSATARRPGDFLPGIGAGDGLGPEAAHFADAFVGMHTFNGVKGRDVR